MNITLRCLLLLGSIVCGVLADPILDDLKVRFHAIEVNASAATNDPVCIACHVPEVSQKRDNIDQLWYRELPRMDVQIDGLDESAHENKPDAFSKACLSCHDGSLANMVTNAPISPCGLPSDAPVSERGTNHPVFMQYPENKKDLQDPSNHLRGEWSGAERVEDLLREKKMVCVSCHVPHHSTETGYLRTTMAGSSLCVGCHKK